MALKSPVLAWSRLKGLATLEQLGLGRTSVTDAGLIQLRGLTKLQSLSLEDTPITDAGLSQLEGLTARRTLTSAAPRLPTPG